MIKPTKTKKISCERQLNVLSKYIYAANYVSCMSHELS